MGGGIFELSFGPKINFFQDVNFPSAVVESVYGIDNQFIPAVWQGPTAVPEPASAALLFSTLVLFAAGVFGRRKALLKNFRTARN